MRSRPRTLPEALSRAAADFPERGVQLLDGRGRRVERHGYAELEARARRAAAHLHALGARRRRPLLVALPSSWSWFEAWFGALVLGAWPVAVAPAGAMGASEVQIQRIEWLLEHLGAGHLVCSAAFRSAAQRLGSRRVVEAAVAAESIGEAAAGDPPRGPQPEPEEVAYLQLTSGSTGLPRAVEVTHANAIHNCLAIDEIVGRPHGAPAHAWADAWISWLPLYHDMGLVGCALGPLVCGLDLWLLSARDFLARPRLWLENLGLRGTTIATAPNFGYQLCVERLRLEQLGGLDLSSWRVALSGAEMVRTETTDAFSRALAPHGFSPFAFRPCYGLAEATLAVTVDTEGEGVRTLPAPAGADAGFAMSDVVCTGRPLEDTELRIVAPDGSVLREGSIGEVQVRGPGVFPGYHNDPVATAETLVDGWLRTGDLGFLDGGELYLTGRIKDVLIVHGQNLMPDELERLADDVTGGGGLLRTAAFSVARGAGGEEVVLVVEVAERGPEALAALEQGIRSRVGRALGLPLADVAFVRRGRIPKTTSGKMKRLELRQRYLEQELERVR